MSDSCRIEVETTTDNFEVEYYRAGTNINPKIVCLADIVGTMFAGKAGLDDDEFGLPEWHIPLAPGHNYDLAEKVIESVNEKISGIDGVECEGYSQIDGGDD